MATTWFYFQYCKLPSDSQFQQLQQQSKIGNRSKATATASNMLKGKFDVVTQVNITTNTEDDARKLKRVKTQCHKLSNSGIP